jgi:transcriptional regulator with XRE-family HTH domain
MNSRQAEKLGARLRKQREALELSIRDLASKAGVPFSTVARIEQGLFDRPRPEKLAALAEVLGMNQTEIMRLAGYEPLSTLPSPSTYLRAKYRHLKSDQLEALGRDVEKVLKRYGISPSEPKPGEDESEPSAMKSTKKGGRP